MKYSRTLSVLLVFLIGQLLELSAGPRSQRPPKVKETHHIRKIKTMPYQGYLPILGTSGLRFAEIEEPPVIIKETVILEEAIVPVSEVYEEPIVEYREPDVTKEEVIIDTYGAYSNDEYEDGLLEEFILRLEKKVPGESDSKLSLPLVLPYGDGKSNMESKSGATYKVK